MGNEHGQLDGRDYELCGPVFEFENTDATGDNVTASFMECPVCGSDSIKWIAPPKIISPQHVEFRLQCGHFGHQFDFIVREVDGQTIGVCRTWADSVPEGTYDAGEP